MSERLPTARHLEQGTEDFRNTETVSETILGNDPDALERLRTFFAGHGVDTARFERIVALQRLREAAHEQARQDVRERVSTSPDPTSVELDMGAYREMLEPHVRDAVMVMRAKGYNTLGSGFGEDDRQVVTFADQDIDQIDVEVLGRLADMGVMVGPKSLVFEATDVDLGALKSKWDALAAALPDRGRAAPPTELGQGKMFRLRAANGTLQEFYGREQ